MRKGSLIRFLVVIGVSLCFTPSFAESQSRQPAPVTLMLINDVYRLENLPAVRTLRQRLEARYGKVLLMHAGDFLFPSLLSRRFKGEQMVDMMNRLDGDAESHDPLMFVTFGNHEFEKDGLDDYGLLNQRIGESQFDWVSSNIQFKNDDQGSPLVHGENLYSHRLVDVEGTRVGIFGITIDSKHPGYVESFGDYVETSRQITGKLRDQGADLVIGLTHLPVAKDKELLGRLGASGPDILLGGHDHERQAAEIRERLVLKADADAGSVAVVRIEPRQGGVPRVEYEFEVLPGGIEADPSLTERVRYWEDRFENEYCSARGLGDRCLEEVIGRTQVDLVAEELTIRRFSTNLGNWIVDRALDEFRGQGAQIAFVNSGSLRLNHNIPAGRVITRKTIDELFAYPSPMAMIRITGAQLKEILLHAVDDWTGSGHWLQISGFEFRHHPERGLVDRIRLRTPDGLRSIGPDEEILAVTNLYLMDDTGDQDGYRMLKPEMMVDANAERPDLRDMVVEALMAAEPEGIAPSLDGRICNAQYMEETCARSRADASRLPEAGR